MFHHTRLAHARTSESLVNTATLCAGQWYTECFPGSDHRRILPEWTCRTVLCGDAGSSCQERGCFYDHMIRADNMIPWYWSRAAVYHGHGPVAWCHRILRYHGMVWYMYSGIGYWVCSWMREERSIAMPRPWIQRLRFRQLKQKNGGATSQDGASGLQILETPREIIWRLPGSLKSLGDERDHIISYILLWTPRLKIMNWCGRTFTILRSSEDHSLIPVMICEKEILSVTDRIHC